MDGQMFGYYKKPNKIQRLRFMKGLVTRRDVYAKNSMRPFLQSSDFRKYVTDNKSKGLEQIKVWRSQFTWM